MAGSGSGQENGSRKSAASKVESAHRKSSSNGGGPKSAPASSQPVSKPLSKIDEQTNETDEQKNVPDSAIVEPIEDSEPTDELKQPETSDGEQTDETKPRDVEEKQIDKKVDEPTEEAPKQPPVDEKQTGEAKPTDVEQTDRSDVERILKDLMRTSEAQAKDAGDKLDRVYKKYNEARNLPVLRRQAGGLALASMEAVEEADCIIGELVAALHRQEEQRRRLAQGSLEVLENILDEEKEHLHRSTALCLDTLGQELGKALALIDQSHASLGDMTAHTGWVQHSNYDHLEGQYHAMIAWARRTQYAMREKCKDAMQTVETEFAKNLLSTGPQVESLLSSLLSLYHTLQAHQELTRVEAAHRRTLAAAHTQQDAARAEIARLGRLHAGQQTRVDAYERLKRELLATERELSGRLAERCAAEREAENSLGQLAACKGEFWGELMGVEALCDEIGCFYSSKVDDE